MAALVPASLPDGRCLTNHDRRAVASPFRDLLDVRILEWERDRCVVEIPVVEQLTNFAGAMAGSVVAAALDMAATLSGCWEPEPTPPRLAVTVTFTITFLAPVKAGSIRASAVKIGGGRQLFTSTITVTAPDGSVAATGQGTFRYVNP
ncbi:MAG: PaaI family thioesterase [Pigmentiphaga sp.]|nr:PaaI family thioesterase [Pigmentiphaga sp.]